MHVYTATYTNHILQHSGHECKLKIASTPLMLHVHHQIPRKPGTQSLMAQPEGPMIQPGSWIVWPEIQMALSYPFFPYCKWNSILDISRDFAPNCRTGDLPETSVVFSKQTALSGASWIASIHRWPPCCMNTLIWWPVIDAPPVWIQSYDDL